MTNRTKHEWRVLWQNSKRRRYLLLGFTITVAVATVQPILVGSVYSEIEVTELLTGLQTSSLYFGSAIATASATVLALMLTLLSMIKQVDTNFDRGIYNSVKLLALITTVTFLGSILLLLGLSLPIGDFNNLPKGWYRVLYYVFSSLNGLLSGLIVMGILVLHNTIRDLIKKLSPD